MREHIRAAVKPREPVENRTGRATQRDQHIASATERCLVTPRRNRPIAAVDLVPLHLGRLEFSGRRKQHEPQIGTKWPRNALRSPPDSLELGIAQHPVPPLSRPP